MTHSIGREPLGSSNGRPFGTSNLQGQVLFVLRAEACWGGPERSPTWNDDVQRRTPQAAR